MDTTPHDLTVGFQACVEAAAAAVGQDLPSFLSALSTLHFSSTIATNTVVERRGARVGLVVTAGAEKDLYAGDAGFVTAAPSLTLRAHHSRSALSARPISALAASRTARPP